MKQGWEIKTLSEIGKVYNGNSINEKVKKDNYSDLDFGFPYIATKDISYKSEINYDNGIKIPFSEKSSFKIAPKNTVLICAEGGSAGRKIGFTNQEVCFGNKLFALATSNDIESRYVYYYYFSETFQKDFSVELVGIIGGVSMNKFKDIEIPLPPLPEQQRIVAILDDAFAAIAKAKANAEQNLKNAKELFESYLQGVFENNVDDWEEKTLGELCKFENGDRGKNYPNRNEYVEIGIPWINTGHIQKDGTLSQTDMNYISEEKFNTLRSGKIQEGDLVYCLRGATLGKTALVAPYTKGAVASSLVIIRPNKELDRRYLYSYLTSPHGQAFIKGYQNGAAQPNLGAKSVAKYLILLPPLEKQKSIVQKLNSLSVKTKKLEAIYQQKINDLEELKKSVLQKAFSGELKTEKEVTV